MQLLPGARLRPSSITCFCSLDDAVLVEEMSIMTGMRMPLYHAGPVIKPSAALGIAAAIEDRERFAGRYVVTVVSGSNVDVNTYHRWVCAAPVHKA